MPEIHIFFVVDFLETALVADEEPLGMRGLIDEQAFSGILRIVLLKPAFDDGGVFGGIFVAQDDLLKKTLEKSLVSVKFPAERDSKLT